MPKYDWEDTERDVSEILQDFLYGIVPQEKYQEGEAIRKRILERERQSERMRGALEWIVGLVPYDIDEDGVRLIIIKAKTALRK